MDHQFGFVVKSERYLFPLSLFDWIKWFMIHFNLPSALIGSFWSAKNRPFRMQYARVQSQWDDRGYIMHLSVNLSLKKCSQMNVQLQQPLLLGTPNALPSRGGVPTEGWGQRWISGALHRVYWSLVDSLRKMIIAFFQTNHRRYIRHTAIYLETSVEEEVCWTSRMFAPSEGRMKWAISHRPETFR